MAEIVYSDQKTNFEKGRHYQNPAYFDGRFPAGTTHVYVLGHWPKVIDAAVEQEIPHTQLAKGAPISWRDGVAPIGKGQTLVEIEDTWRHFGNPRIIELAARIAQRDVANRKQAVRIIEDELERRVAADEHATPDNDEPDSPKDENQDTPDSPEDEDNDNQDEQQQEDEAPAKRSRRGNRRK